ncbi:MAG: hypothetical protein KDC38_11210 [Planctomycetes bacterium]|nr:hypothetical protein [Planctomycetota bacterium]
MDPKTALRSLSAAPRTIEALTRGMNDAKLRKKPDAKNWSAHELLALLRCCADLWAKFIARCSRRIHRHCVTSRRAVS